MSLKAYADTELAIQVSHVYKQYGRGRSAQKVLKGICMDVHYHTIYALLGASGCGKTTLLRCCLGFLRQNSGVITVMGNYPGSRGTSIPGTQLGYMPQDLGLVPEFSIMETMYFFGVMFKMGFKQIRQRAEFLRNLLELPPLKKRISQMSGGEQRRVSFAVSLIQEPPLLILDEPTVGMDSLLRQSVWQYIAKLTVAKHCTVVITTHYIDEARRADTVGLMRGGKLLTQSKPEDLIRMHNAVTLEEVFVKLAYKQAEDEDKSHSSPNVDISKSIQAGDSEPSVDVRKKLSFIDNYFPRFLWSFHFAIVMAITLKTAIKTVRSFGTLLFILSIPTSTVIAFTYFVGRDIRDVKLYYHSTDFVTNQQLNKNYSETFIKELITSNTFDAEQASSLAEARKKIEDGDAYLRVSIGRNFSDALYTRYYQRCMAMDDLDDFPGEQVVNDSTIHLTVDGTDVQLILQSEIVLNSKGKIMLNQFFKDSFNATFNQLARPPVLLKRAVFGSLDWEYSDFIGSSILTAIVFLNSISMTAMSFVVERKEGLFERAYAAGSSVTDYVLAYSLHASVIFMIQAVLLMVVVFGIFGIEMKGNAFLFGLMVWLTSMVASGIGLLLSGQVYDEMGAQNISQMIGAMSVFLCGSMWPLNAQPVILRWISKSIVIPTWPSVAASAIGAKGLGLGDEPVYVGYLVILSWGLVIYLASIAFFHKN